MTKNQITRSERPGSATVKKEEVDFLKWLMVGVILVLGIALGGLLTNYLAEKKASFTDLRDEVKSQNDKIEALTEQVKKANDQKTTQ